MNEDEKIFMCLPRYFKCGSEAEGNERFCFSRGFNVCCDDLCCSNGMHCKREESAEAGATSQCAWPFNWMLIVYVGSGVAGLVIILIILIILKKKQMCCFKKGLKPFQEDTDTEGQPTMRVTDV